MFSTPANLGIVAYAKVNLDGNSLDLNSGVVTARITSPSPYYTITLPGDPTQQEPLQEGQSKIPARDLIFITPYEGAPVTFQIHDISDFIKQVSFTDLAGNPAETNFYVLILRSLISPPTDAQGNYIAPA